MRWQKKELRKVHRCLTMTDYHHWENQPRLSPSAHPNTLLMTCCYRGCYLKSLWLIPYKIVVKTEEIGWHFFPIEGFNTFCIPFVHNQIGLEFAFHLNFSNYSSIEIDDSIAFDLSYNRLLSLSFCYVI